MSLLPVKFFKNSYILARIYFIFLKKRPKTNLKCFQYQIPTSVKRLEKQFKSKASFGPCLRLNYSNFRLKQCERP